MLRKRTSTDVAVENLSRDTSTKAKRSSIDPPTVEKLSRIQEHSRSIHLVVEEVSRLR